MSKSTNSTKNKKSPIKNDKIIYEKPKLNISTPINEMKILTPTFQELSKILNSKHNCLILDLEFFVSNNPNNGRRPRQIAGKVFNTTVHFNYITFSGDMTEHDQMQLLKDTDLRYSEATKLKIKSVLSRIGKIVKDQSVKYIISYDNHLDFKTIKDESKFDIFNNTTAIDLSSILRENLFDHSSQAPSLENFCKLLNLQNSDKYHDAYSDVLMIDRICQRYAYDLNESDMISPLF